MSGETIHQKRQTTAHKRQNQSVTNASTNPKHLNFTPKFRNRNCTGRKRIFFYSHTNKKNSVAFRSDFSSISYRFLNWKAILFYINLKPFYLFFSCLITFYLIVSYFILKNTLSYLIVSCLILSYLSNLSNLNVAKQTIDQPKINQKQTLNKQQANPK